MDIGAIFLVLAVVLLVGLFVGQPLMERRARRVTGEGHEVSALMAERDRVVNALQELDFDHALGKIPADDYPVQRAALLQKGADVLRQLDSFPSPARAERSASGDEAGIGIGSEGMSAEERVESAVAARRADASAQAASALDDDDIEALIAARRKSRKGKSGGFCPKCGKPVLASDRFCPHCGKALK
ncbi:MAG: zinc ribbon domain-containing protein [Chloroflexota bacterium]